MEEPRVAIWVWVLICGGGAWLIWVWVLRSVTCRLQFGFWWWSIWDFGLLWWTSTWGRGAVGGPGFVGPWVATHHGSWDWWIETTPSTVGLLINHSRNTHIFLRCGVFFSYRYLYLPVLTHSNNICIKGKLEFDGWIFPLFTEMSMIYWMDRRKREREKIERGWDLWSGWFGFNFSRFEKSLKYMFGFEIGVSNICLGLNSFVLKFH